MSSLKFIDTKRLQRDFNNLRGDWNRGIEEKKLSKKYKYLRETSESLYRVATREENPMDKILLKKLLTSIDNRQSGKMTKREAEESFGGALGDVYVKPVGTKLEAGEQARPADLPPEAEATAGAEN